MDDVQFVKDLEKTVFEADEKIDRDELITDVFKFYVSKIFEMNLENDRLPAGVLSDAKRMLINTFRKASLETHQRSVEQYEKLFDSTVAEIVNFASHNHGGTDIVEEDGSRVLEVNKKAYHNENVGAGFKRSAGGIIIPD